MKEAFDRLEEWVSGKQAPPIKMDLFLTNKCNLKCLFCGCHNLRNRPLEEISEEKWLSIIKEASTLGMKTIGILGGEPFVRSDTIIRVMQKIKDEGMCGALTTNGTIFNKNMVQQIVNMKWDMLRFSIDGATAKTHDYLRGAKSFSSVISSLKLFKNIKRRYKSCTPTIEFSTVLCNKNYQELEKIGRLAIKFECKKIYILPIIQLTPESADLKISNEEMQSVKDILIKTRTLLCKHNVESNIAFILENQFDKNDSKKISDSRRVFCYQPWYSLAIHANGTVVPCANFDDSKGENVLKKSVRDIWFGDYFKRIRGSLLNNDITGPCERCCMPIAEENKIISDKLKE